MKLFALTRKSYGGARNKPRISVPCTTGAGLKIILKKILKNLTVLRYVS